MPRRPVVARTALGLFCLSCVFPIVASLMRPQAVSAWMGVTDVAIALVVCAFGMRLVAWTTDLPAQTQLRCFRLYRAMAVVPLLLLTVFFLAGDRIRWDVLLPGLAWRSWLFAYTLPSGLAVLAADR